MKKLNLTELNRLSIEEFRETNKIPVVLVLDNIRSALNVGSIFRSSDAFALRHIHLCGITARPPHKEINKTAIGATASVAWSYHKDIELLIKKLKAEGYKIIGVEQTDSSVELQKFSINSGDQYALVLGNEVEGVSEALLAELDAAIEIPQYGTKHSLNVAVCTGIVIWEFRKFYINNPA